MNKYSTTQFGDKYSDFLDIIKKRDTYTIQDSDNSINNYLIYDKLKFENIFADYILKNENQSVSVEYQLYENNKVVSSVIILKMNPIYKTEIFKEEEKYLLIIF